MRHIAIVTGASSGVGREFVRQLGQGAGGPLDEIWLVARGADALREVAGTSPVPCRVLPLDLCDPASFDAISSELAAEPDARVDWLVNSAGLGRTGSLSDVSREDEQAMVRLNCLAVVEMCRLALPHMGPGSRIVNMASIAGSVPLPRFATYSASKAFVETFSRAIDADLRGAGIRATAVCPKWMRTGFVSSIGDREAYEEMCAIGFEDPTHAVASAIRAAVAGRPLCVPSPDMRVAHALCRALPVGAVLGAMALLARARR